MGKLIAFSRRSPYNPDVYAPVNYRPTERCRTLVFDPTDGNDYHVRFDAVAVQYALDEQHLTGYHMVELPGSDGPLLRYMERRPNGLIFVKKHKAYPDGDAYPADNLKVLGFVFQFIRDLDTGERWELIRGPAFPVGSEEVASHQLYDVK
jgi:hypothetical protein